jgi:hypothetical protein
MRNTLPRRNGQGELRQRVGAVALPRATAFSGST